MLSARRVSRVRLAATGDYPAFASLSMAGSEGISEATLYNWRKAAWAEGRLLPDGDSTPRRLELGRTSLPLYWRRQP